MIATVLFTDIVGSTERASELGDRRWREILRAHHDAVRGELRRHHGQEVATAGDGFLAVFDSPSNALLCAAAIREAVRDLGLSVRCGLHMGEVEREARDVGGIAVHIGARVAALAGRDEILVSGTVRDAETGSEFRFEDRGRHPLKGVAGEWRVFALSHVPPDLRATPAAAPPDAGVLQRLGGWGVTKVVGVYAILAGGVYVVGSLLHTRLGMPSWVPLVMVVLLVIGLGVVLSTAWASERSRGGFRDAARSVARGQLPHLTWGRAIAGGVFALAILFGVAGLWVVIQDRGRSFAPDEAFADAAPGVAVLPFSVQGEGLDVWREGAVDLIGSNIDGAAGLRAIDSRTLLARWHEEIGEDEQPDLARSLEVARRTGARYALVGSAVALGRDLRLTADIYDVGSGKSLGQAQVEGAPDSVYMLVDRLSIEALRTILGGADDLPRVELARVTTASLPALKAYLEGEVLYRKADWTGALAAYREAVEADSTFALAWRRVGEAIGWMPLSDRPPGGPFEAAQAAARHSDRLSEREAVLVRAYRAFVVGSMSMLDPLRAAARRYPDDPELWYLLGEHYAHFDDQLLVEPEETARTLERAIELDPTFAPYYQHPIEYAFYLADSARALQLLATFQQLAGETFEARRYRLAYQLAWGSPPERANALAALDTIRDARAMPTFLLGHPRFVEARLATLDRPREGATLQYFEGNLMSGRVDAVEQGLRVEELVPGPGFETMVRFVEREYGLPVDSDTLRALSRADTLWPNAFLAAALATEDDRAAELRATLEKWSRFQRTLLETGDTLMADQMSGEIKAIQGYAALHRGDRERALELLQEGQRQATGWNEAEAVNFVLRLWIARLLVDLDRHEEAIPYYRSFHNDPYAALELGKVYEAVGRRDEAREQFEIALASWRQADPALAPKVAEARQRLAGLGFRPRG